MMRAPPDRMTTRKHGSGVFLSSHPAAPRRSHATLTVSQRGLGTTRNPEELDDLDELDWDVPNEPAETAEARAGKLVEDVVPSSKPRPRTSIVPPRKRDSEPPWVRTAETGRAVPPCPAWTRSPEARQPLESVPPFAHAANLAATGERERDFHAHAASDPDIPVSFAMPPVPQIQTAPPAVDDTIRPVASTAVAVAAPKARRSRALLVGAAAAMVTVGLAGVAVARLASAATAKEAPARCVTAMGSLSAALQANAIASRDENVGEAAGPSPLPASNACSIAGQPRQLLSSASDKAPMEAVVDLSGEHVGLGLAAVNGRPVGFLLRLASLQTERSAMEWAPGPLLRVVPSLQEAEFSVVSDVADPEPASELAFSLRSPSPMKLGTFRKHLTLSEGEGVPEVLWQVPGGGRPDGLDAAGDAEHGAVVALRVDGSLYVGRADTAERPDGPLVQLAREHAAVGSLRVAARGDEVVVAFEAKSPAGTTMVVASPEGNQGSEHAWQCAPKPGATLTEPSVQPVADDRWLVSWTEQRDHATQVRMQTLDASLRPVGEAVDVTPASVRASGSVLAVGSAAGAVFYFKQGVSSREAWVASVRCP